MTEARYSTADVYFMPRYATVGTTLSYSLLVVFVILLYSQLPMLLPFLEVARPVYVVGGAGMVAVLIETMLSRRDFRFVWPESYLLVGFVAAAGLSCFNALWTRYAVDNTVDLIKIAALYFVIVNAISTVGRLRALIWVMVGGGLFPAIGALWNYAQGQLVEGRASWVGIFVNPNELAYSLVILIPLAGSLAATVSGRMAALLWTFVLIYIAAVYVSFSRGGMLGLLVVLAVAALKWRSAATKMLTLLLLVGALAWMAYGWSRQEGFGQLGMDTTMHQRLTTIRAGLAMFADHPITGVGLGSSVVAWPLYAPSDAYGGKWLMIHNTFVQALSETGIIGFVLFTLLLATSLSDVRRMAHGAPHYAPLAIGLELSLWAFIVCGLSGGFLLSWFPYILIGLVSSLKQLGAEHSMASEVPARG